MSIIKKIENCKEIILGLFLILIIILNIVLCCKPFYNGWYYGERNGVKVEICFNEKTYVGEINKKKDDENSILYLSGYWEKHEDSFVLNNINGISITFERCSTFLLQGKFMGDQVISVYCPIAIFLQVLYGVIYVLYVIIFIIFFAKYHERKLIEKASG